MRVDARGYAARLQRRQATGVVVVAVGEKQVRRGCRRDTEVLRVGEKGVILAHVK
ncbi:MAG: hypothetical protein BWY76_00526 [bacterium ADurb.Bin429]|nr:MAG: hypothetical protein BWY76_00526 [bacterium ADurb.Bin429]